MRYNTKAEKDGEKDWGTAILFLCVTVFFLCFALSEAGRDCSLPEWMLETYKKLPK